MKVQILKANNVVLALNANGCVKLKTDNYIDLVAKAYERGSDKKSLFWILHNDWLNVEIVKAVFKVWSMSIKQAANYEKPRKISFYNPHKEINETIWYDAATQMQKALPYVGHYDKETNQSFFIYQEGENVIKGVLSGFVSVGEYTFSELLEKVEKQAKKNRLDNFLKGLMNEFQTVIDVTGKEHDLKALIQEHNAVSWKYRTYFQEGKVFLCMKSEPVKSQSISDEERFRKSIKKLYDDSKLPENKWVTVNLNEKTFRICNVNTYLEKHLTSTQGIYITGNHKFTPFDTPVLLFREKLVKLDKTNILYLTNDIISFINKSGKPLHIDL